VGLPKSNFRVKMLEKIINYHKNENIKKIQKGLDYSTLLVGLSLGSINGQDITLQPEVRYALAFGPAVVRGLFEGVIEAYDAYRGNGLYGDMNEGLLKYRPIRAVLASSKVSYGFAIGFFETIGGVFVGNLVGTNL